MNLPVKYLTDTPTLENAMSRVENQFILDGLVVKSNNPTGGGKFRIETESSIFNYQWSHISGTYRIVEF